MTSYLFTAVHLGPYRSIQPLEAELGSGNVSYLLSGISQEERFRMGLHHWDLAGINQECGGLGNFLKQTGIQAIIRGTSEDVTEDNVEAMVSVAAQRLGIPVFAVEDYPGNHWTKAQERLDGLFVENQTIVGLHSTRGVDPDLIHPTGNPRYDEFAKIDYDEKRRIARSGLGLAGQRVMVWAGQPDGDNSYLALERLLGRYEGRQATVLFRAHPRDDLYRSGRYDNFPRNSALSLVDVSSYPEMSDLLCAADLVATQFSSAAVEASHLGIPALFVIFDDLGGRYLVTNKGFALPPWCEDQCSFLIRHEDDIQPTMDQALWGEHSRSTIQTNFQHHFGTHGRSGTTIAQNISKIILNKMDNLSPANT